MSFSYGLDKLMGKYNLISQQDRQLVNKTPQNLFQVVHQNELLKNERELFLREYLFRNQGGFPFNEKNGLPEIRSYNKYLPKVLKGGNETGEEILEENEIGNLASDITDIAPATGEINDDIDLEQVQKNIKEELKNKSLQQKQFITRNIGSGSGKPIFSFNRNLKLEDIPQLSNGSGDPSENESVPSGTGVPEEEKEKNEDENYNADVSDSLKETKPKVTQKQKDRIKQIVGSEDYKEDTGMRKAQAIIIIDKDGNIVGNAPSKRKLKDLKEEGLIKSIKSVKISNYGTFIELDDDKIAVTVPKSYYNKQFPKQKTLKETSKTGSKVNILLSTPKLKRNTSNMEPSQIEL
jgi:hypothetical protein